MRTAVIAAVTVWVLGTLSSVGEVIIGLIPADALIVPTIWSLGELIVAAIAGAWLYREA